MRELIRLVEAAPQTATTDSRSDPLFRAWFGGSKVVDSAGNPLPVFHGSNSHAYVEGGIDIFHTLPASGRGAAFFSSSKQLAGEYGERLYSVFLRVENPLIVFGDGKHWTALDHNTRISGRVTGKLRDYHRTQARQLDDIFRELSSLDGTEDTPPTKSKIPDNVHDVDRFQLGILSNMEGSAETDQVVKQARRMGYDGVIFRDILDSPTNDTNLYKHTVADVYAVFSSHQIKSVQNAGTWDRDDPSIHV